MIAGHSHAGILGMSPPDSNDAPPHLKPLTNGDPRFLGLSAGWPREDAYWDALVEAGERRRIALIWGGNAHQVYFLFAPSPPIDVVASADPDLPVESSARLIPETAIRALFDWDIAPLRDLLRRLAKEGSDTCVVGTPPPKGNIARLRAQPEPDPLFLTQTSLLGIDFADAQFAPALLRYKLWLVLQSAYRDAANEFGFPFMPVPTEIQTPDGLLREEYWGRDITHAGGNYGALLLDALHRFVTFAR